jgi:putative transposase
MADHGCVVALGITIDGTRVPLALAEGATENALVMGDLLACFRDRGLEVTRRDRLRDAVASVVAKRMRATYRNPDPLMAQAELEALARELDRSHPGAAGSPREGLAKILIIQRWALAGRQMVLRWMAAGVGEAAKQFRRVNGHLHLPASG